ncbi:protein CNPPD1 isoform X2 [Malaya genurostris]|uniref:protein CNPPD1 isoform X2 n=1 Tax=Malaya genurostris TaxID=325434 RepID=UPI0026F38EB2|nr:protein CNPPD1 isoform X2 [Malaya genurostris]
MFSFSLRQAKDHEEFLNRIKKTLYYGTSTVQCTKISRPLADYAADIFSESHRGHSLSRLNFVTVGNLTVTPCSLILAMIYLDRLNTIDPAYARRITPSELFIVSMMVSTKFYCGYDEDIYLSAWAESGCMSIDHMKALELEFLDAIEWNVYVSNHDFFEKLKTVEKVLANRQGIARGWLTYTELINLLPALTLAKQILNYSTVIALSYTASVMTIAGAFFLASNINVPGNVLFRVNSTQTATVLEGMTTTGVASEPSTLGQNCSAQIQSTNSTIGSCLTLEDCECSLQMAMENAQFLGHSYANNNAKFDSHHHKAYFTPLPIVWFAQPTAKYGFTVNWKHYRFMFPSAVGNDDEDDESHNRNCTTEEQFSALCIGEISQRNTMQNDQQSENRAYTNYKRTYEMFSSLLKFL